MDEQKNNWPVIISILPFLGFFYFFVYEYGFFSYYNIPFELLTIKIEVVLFFVLSLFMIAAIVYYSIDAWYPVIMSFFIKGTFQRFIIFKTVQYILILLVGVLHYDKKAYAATSWFFYTAGIIFIWGDLIWPMLKPLIAVTFIEKDKTFIDKFNSNYKAYLFSDVTLTDKIASDKKRVPFILLFVAALYLVAIINGAGKVSASMKKSFYTIGYDSTFVLIKQSGDKYILGKLKEIKNKNVKEILIINGDADSIKLVPYILK